MEITINEYIGKCFRFLVDKHNYVIVDSSVRNKDKFKYMYKSERIIIKLERYKGEIYCNLSRVDDFDNEINLFNLITYQDRKLGIETRSKYYKNLSNTIIRYQKQIEWIALQLKSNIEKIDNFFHSERYKHNIKEINEFMVKKYPSLFPRIK